MWSRKCCPACAGCCATIPSPFTFTGTLCYIVGKGKVALIDPGPDDAAHAKAVLDAVRGETVTHIFVTHTHTDHSPNTPRVKAATGAKIYADGNPLISRFVVDGEKRTSEAGGDTTFVADVKLTDGAGGRGRRLVAAGRCHARSCVEPYGVRLA